MMKRAWNSLVEKEVVKLRFPFDTVENN
jgi:hypothetical protein